MPNLNQILSLSQVPNLSPAQSLNLVLLNLNPALSPSLRPSLNLMPRVNLNPARNQSLVQNLNLAQLSQNLVPPNQNPHLNPNLLLNLSQALMVYSYDFDRRVFLQEYFIF